MAPFAGVAAAAQTVSCTTGNGAKSSCPTPLPQLSFTLVVPRVVQLTLSAASLNLINNNASATDYEAGFKSAPSLTVTAFADTGAVVTMSAATTNFTAPAGVTKPASTLQASLDGTTFNDHWNLPAGEEWGSVWHWGQAAQDAGVTQDDSPALKLGFVNFPMDQFGVQKPELKKIARTPDMPKIFTAASSVA